MRLLGGLNVSEIDRLSDDEQEVVLRSMLAETQQEKDALIEEFDQESRLRILSAICDYRLKLNNKDKVSDEEDCNEYEYEYDHDPNFM